MYIVLMGPPGAGKGTQAERLVASLGLTHVATGDIFREAVRSESPLGREVKKYMDRGDLVPDSLAVQAVMNRLGQDDCNSGAILDGFPRTVEQAISLDEDFKRMGRSITAALDVQAGTEVLVERLAGRRVCRDCQAAYHVRFSPPEVPGRCDRCGGTLYQRSDDAEGTVRHRLEVYTKQTAPVLRYYQRQTKLYTVDGSQDIATTTENVLQAVKRAMAKG